MKQFRNVYIWTRISEDHARKSKIKSFYFSLYVFIFILMSICFKILDSIINVNQTIHGRKEMFKRFEIFCPLLLSSEFDRDTYKIRKWSNKIWHDVKSTYQNILIGLCLSNNYQDLFSLPLLQSFKIDP